MDVHTYARHPLSGSPHPGCAAEHVLRAQALVDTHIHASARGVLEALARHDCGPALAWCEANRPRLRKQKSKLEFKLRVQARPPRTGFREP